MPYTALGLPFSGPMSSLSSDASHAGAIDAEPRAATQTRRYLEMLQRMGDYGMTDFEGAVLLGIQRSTINARRGELMKRGLVCAGGFRKGPSGVKNVVWKCR